MPFFPRIIKCSIVFFSCVVLRRRTALGYPAAYRTGNYANGQKSVFQRAVYYASTRLVIQSYCPCAANAMLRSRPYRGDWKAPAVTADVQRLSLRRAAEAT
jgi:hypothetical protein